MKNTKRHLLFAALGLGALVLIVVLLPPAEKTAVSGDAYSNIHPQDYVGPERCAECHAEQYRKWQTHPHSRMNLNPTEQSVLGDFSGVRVEYGDGYVQFDTRGDEYFISLFGHDQLAREYRVTRTVGSQYTQMYIGLQTIGPEPPDHQVYHIEGKLPFGYWIRRQLWTPVSYFDSAYEAESTSGSEQMTTLAHVPRDTKWELNCLYCHNTYAYQHRLYFGDVLGFPREDFRFPEGAASIDKWGALTPDKLVTLGVSCESCHYGGREHVEHGKPVRYYPTSPELQVTNISSATPEHDASLINSICLQCHCANVTLYPNQAGLWNSREAIDLQSGACQQQLKCTDCHDPHPAGRHGGLFSEQKINQKCLECHSSFKADKQRQAHSQHTLDSVSCVDCHMPRIVQGLDKVVRTHHIDSPTDEVMLSMSAPNACNLCHLDKPITWTVEQLNRGWKTDLEINSKWSSEYGEQNQLPVGDVWLNHSQPIMKLLAADAFSRSALGPDKVADLLELLNAPYAVNRMFGLLAIERILDRKLTAEEYLPTASVTERAEMVRHLKDNLNRPSD